MGLAVIGNAAYLLPANYATNGSVVINSGAQLVAGNSLMLLSSGVSTIAPGVTLAAKAAQLQSSQINVGSIDDTTRAALFSAGAGLVLDQGHSTTSPELIR
jgi:hypothetical protein